MITGEEDFITGPACAREIADGIPHAETVVLPGVGHMIFVEGPEAVPRGRALVPRVGAR